MKVTTVRFGHDVWRLLEEEAALAGVSASQYIREAALARASAAAAARGEDPVALLAGAPPQIPPDLGARASRERAAATLEEQRATAAEVQLASRRNRELRQKAAEIISARPPRARGQTRDPEAG